MGRVIAVTNLKGGVGKTTTVVNVSAGLALKGARVLLVDVDAQGNLAMALGVRPRRTIYEVLVDGASVADCVTTARPNLDLLAGDESLLTAQAVIGDRPDKAHLLQRTLRPIVRDYDFIFIDCGGSLTILNINAMMAATDLLVPTAVEHLSIRGLELLFKQIQRIKGGMSGTQVIVPTMFDPRRKQSDDYLGQLRSTYGERVMQPIRINVKLSEAPAAGRTIYEYDPRSRGALDYATLVEQVSALWQFDPNAHVPPVVPTVSPHAPVSAPESISVEAVAPARVEMTPPPPLISPEDATPTIITSPSKHQPLRRLSVERPLVTGSSAVQLTCPNCGHTLRRTTVAGYQVAYCDNCKYRRQELLNGTRP